ncbi:MFS family transporter [Variovorax brevis]|uniref:MFS family transporter n=1 Tax=Variovorax brevis TaxID=3053503 RepID=UPI0040380D55
MSEVLSARAPHQVAGFSPSPVPKLSAIKSILIASSGNIVEWFDFFAYAFTAIYFAPAFFPSSNPTTQLLNTAGIFAAGFFMRPLGGWVFGRIADRQGRKTSMVLSVILMCVGSLIIACLPTYSSIGLWAAALLLVARLLQGLSVGGEYGTSATYMSEIATEGRRGFYGSFHYATIIAGQLLAVMVIAVLQQVLSLDDLKAWGWRIPFFIGAAGALVALVVRRSMVETREGHGKDPESGTIRGVLAHPRALLIVLGFTAGGSLIFYTFTSYMQKYLVNSAHMDAKVASHVMTGVLFIFMCIQPLFGALSDRIGRRNSMLIYGLFFTFATVPLMTSIGAAKDAGTAFALALVALVGMSFYTSISGLVKAQMFPAQIRALAVGLPYAIANAMFGGTAEFVALSFKANGTESHFFWYVTVMGAVVLISALFMPDERKSDYLRSKS